MPETTPTPVTVTPRTAFVAVGSNIEPARNIASALAALARLVEVTGTSAFYRTAPVGRPEQPAFYNGVWRIETALAPAAVKFDVLRRIESDLGRHRTQDKYAARSIDLDLILYDDVVIDTPDLRLPDPEIIERSFVAVPLLELSPALVLPDTGKRLDSLPVARSTRGLEKLDPFTEQLRNRLKK
jgi:2-amino-4-hydroxy-6-hydroxymethyldihydropteridine diphosphokinase